LALESFPSLEAQAGAIADDIAYDSHDIDDGLRAELFALGALAELPLVGDLLAEVLLRTPTSSRPGATAN
jgi:dGTPase